MEIQCVSDLHLEFKSHTIIDSIMASDSEILIIAGDLTISKYLIKELYNLYRIIQKHIVFVAGNHEYYGATKYYVDEQLYNEFHQHPHIHVLNNSIWKHKDVVFIGSTGWWTSPSAKNAIKHMSDYTHILDIIPANYGIDWGIQSYNFFKENLEKYQNDKVVCISHNAPSLACVDPEFENSILNPCFANDWDNLILDYNPLMWVYGHMHQSKDFYLTNKISDYNLGTRLFSNPYGYHKYEVNHSFDPCSTIKI